jgi:hypothetical protein
MRVEQLSGGRHQPKTRRPLPDQTITHNITSFERTRAGLAAAAANT